MWLIVGLGNPGRQYELTRHNIGFMCIDTICQKLRLADFKTEQKAHVARGRLHDSDCLFVKPQTYMNLSGDSVQPLLHFYKIPLENLIVVHDEIDLPPFQLKVQKKRGHGGHNGIRDITEKLETNDYTRLRLGVGRPGQTEESHAEMQVSDYVLQKFTQSEMDKMKQFLQYATEAIESLVVHGFERTINKYNQQNAK